jgi:glucose-6-phosphate isomerase
MPLIQSIDLAHEDRIGPQGADKAALDKALSDAGAALDWLRAQYEDRSLPLLRYPGRHDDLPQIRDTGRRIADRATDVVFFGTGGSSLGGQTLAQLAGYAVPGIGLLRAPPRIHFMDNLDSHTFGAFLDKLPHGTTRYVAVSKSGGTAETLMQTITALSAVKSAGHGTQIPDIFLGLTESAKSGASNGMRDLLSAHKIPMLDHDPGVGGRFSVLTNVGLLPAAVLDLDIAAIREGASRALQPVMDKKAAADVPAALGAALAVTMAKKAKPVSIMLAYADRLERFTRWYVQLWAESLGKDGHGTTPVAAIGPVDQHSQLQLYIGGPRDKLVTVITTDGAGEGPRVDAAMAKTAHEPGLGGKTVGDLVAAQGRATAETLAKNGVPVRTIHVPRLDEESLGELLMHFMLETIIAARLLGVNAFDQPAVEEGKVLAKRYLAGG